MFQVPRSGVGPSIRFFAWLIRERHPRRHELVVDAELPLRLLDDRDLIGGVVDDEVARQPDLRRLAPEQRAQRVERRQPHALASSPISASTRSRISPAALLVNVTARTWSGLRVPVADEVGDAIGDDARLAGSGAGEDQQGSISMQHRFALFRVKLSRESPLGRTLIARSIPGLGTRDSAFATSEG